MKFYLRSAAALAASAAYTSISVTDQLAEVIESLADTLAGWSRR